MKRKNYGWIAFFTAIRSAFAKQGDIDSRKQVEEWNSALKQILDNALIDSRAEVIEELIAMARDMQEAWKRNEGLGLNPEEIAFYDALAENASAVRELGDETLKVLATELTRKLRASTTVDWRVRESVRAKMRILIRRLLRRYKYPPDGEASAIELVLEQAAELSDEWTR